MDRDEEIIKRLDRIIFLMGLAYREQLEDARREVLTEPVSAALLDAAAEDWITAGDLRRRVATATKQSERTVSRRLSELVDGGWIEAAGSGPSVKYRSGGWA